MIISEKQLKTQLNKLKGKNINVYIIGDIKVKISLKDIDVEFDNSYVFLHGRKIMDIIGIELGQVNIRKCIKNTIELCLDSRAKINYYVR